MTVYVDDAKHPYGSMLMCHMLADSDEELHAMADKIGVKRRWFQKAGTHQCHYDICKSKRQLAVVHGAIEINRFQLGAMLHHRFHTGKLGPLDEAIAWYRERKRSEATDS